PCPPCAIPTLPRHEHSPSVRDPTLPLAVKAAADHQRLRRILGKGGGLKRAFAKDEARTRSLDKPSVLTTFTERLATRSQDSRR
ncbi:MAG: hypothetical protein ACKOU6_05530, partial [Planctomycetota bacterium]